MIFLLSGVYKTNILRSSWLKEKIDGVIMSLIEIGLVVFFNIIIFSGILVIFRSKLINDWIYNWSSRFLKQFGDIHNPEGQLQTSLWIIRLAGFLLVIFSALALYFLIINIS